MQRFSPRDGGKEWCEQCESLKTAPAARACRDRFCKLQALLPPEANNGFTTRPQRTTVPVAVHPEIIARVERVRAETPPPKVVVMAIPVVQLRTKTSQKRDENGLTPKIRALLAEMEKRAGPDNTVEVSFSDVAATIGVPHSPSVAPLMQQLVERRYVTIIERRGGRAKTRYLVHGIEQDRVAVLPPGGPVEQLADEAPSILRAEMPADPERSPREACGNCRFAHVLGIGSMRCRRLPPDSRAGHPIIKAVDWCGEFQKSA